MRRFCWADCTVTSSYSQLATLCPIPMPKHIRCIQEPVGMTACLLQSQEYTRDRKTGQKLLLSRQLLVYGIVPFSGNCKIGCWWNECSGNRSSRKQSGYFEAHASYGSVCFTETILSCLWIYMPWCLTLRKACLFCIPHETNKSVLSSTKLFNKRSYSDTPFSLMPWHIRPLIQPDLETIFFSLQKCGEGANSLEPSNSTLQ